MSNPSIAPRLRSGQSFIDGILWLESDGITYKAHYLRDLEITYGFSDNLGPDAPDGSILGTPWQPAEKLAIEDALTEITKYINVSFQRVEDEPDDAVIVLHKVDNGDLDSLGGKANPPAPSERHRGHIYFNESAFLFGARVPSEFRFQKGGIAFYTILHEISHVLGLAHTEDFIRYPLKRNESVNEYDDFIYTIMSVEVVDRGARTDAFANPSTLSGLDIAALQYLYGSRKEHEEGDNIYRFSDVFNNSYSDGPGTFYSTIYDTGGRDKITAILSSKKVVIDLNDLSTDPSFMRQEYKNVSSELGLKFAINNYVSSSIVGSESDGKLIAKGGYLIAPGTLIEDADGSRYGDFIIGNEIDNILSGYGGNDTIYGLEGDDVIISGDGVNVLFGGSGNDILIGGIQREVEPQ